MQSSPFSSPVMSSICRGLRSNLGSFAVLCLYHSVLSSSRLWGIVAGTHEASPISPGLDMVGWQLLMTMVSTSALMNHEDHTTASFCSAPRPLVTHPLLQNFHTPAGGFKALSCLSLFLCGIQGCARLC